MAVAMGATSGRCLGPRAGNLQRVRGRRAEGCRCGASSGLYQVGSTAERLKPSKTVAISDLATEMKREGKDVISLAPGEPYFDTPKRIARAGQGAIEEGKTKYSPNADLADLREAIVKKLARENGIGGLSAAGNVVVTNGAKQAIAETILASCSPGDQVVVPSPYWVSYPEMASLAGAEPVFVETKLEDDFLLTPEGLEGKAALSLPLSLPRTLLSPKKRTKAD